MTILLVLFMIVCIMYAASYLPENRRPFYALLVPNKELASRPYYKNTKEQIESKVERTLLRLNSAMEIIRVYNEIIVVLEKHFPTENLYLLSAYFIDIYAYINNIKITNPDKRTKGMGLENKAALAATIADLSPEAYQLVKNNFIDLDFKENIFHNAYAIFITLEDLVLEYEKRGELFNANKGTARTVRNKIIKIFPHLTVELNDIKDYKQIFSKIKKELILHNIITDFENEPLGV